MSEQVGAGALLVVQLLGIGWFLKGDVTRWRGFRGLADSDADDGARRRRYWRWCVKDLLVFAAPPLVGLALLGRLDALTAAPPEFAGLRATLPTLGPDALRVAAMSAGVGMLGGTAVVVALSRWRRGRGLLRTLGNVSALLPRTRADLGAAAVLSLTAGVTEELAFRLFVPLLLTLVTGSAPVAFAGAALLFGAMHRYQGWVGVLATTVVGLLLTAVFVASGLIWTAMVVHVVIDLNGLVVRPLLTGGVRRAG